MCQKFTVVYCGLLDLVIMTELVLFWLYTICFFVRHRCYSEVNIDLVQYIGSWNVVSLLKINKSWYTKIIIVAYESGLEGSIFILAIDSKVFVWGFI